MRRSFLLALALVLSACTIGEEAPTSADRTPDPAARTGGTLRVGILKPASIDPSLATIRDPAGYLVVSVLCDPPVSFDPVTGEPRPAVARRFQSTESGENITATLRKDIKMHNGETVGAEDITYALSRAAHPDTVSPSAELLEEVNLFDRLREDRVEGDLLPGARIIGPLDLELVVPGQLGDLQRVLGHPIAAPLPRDMLRPFREQEREEEFAQQPACNGAYQLADAWTPEETEIRLVRFDDYYGENAAYTRGGAGYTDEIVFRIYPDLAAQLEAFKRGEIDVAHVPEDRLAEARTLGTVVDTPTSRLDYIGLPTSTAPFDDRRVRVAMSQALDRETLVERVYGGAREPAGGFLPPTLGDDVYREQACAVNAPLGGDVAAARRTLGGARGTLDAQTVPLYFNDEFGHRRLVEEVARQWTDAFGVRFELKPMEWEAYLQQGTSPSGFDGPFRFGWSTEYPSPHQILEPLFHSSNIGATNLSRFSDRRFDRSLEREARRATTLEDQTAEYQELEDLACGQMPIVPVAFGTTHFLVREGSVGSAVGRYTDVTTALPVIRELYVKR